MTRKPRKKRALPEPLPLRKHLDACTVPELVEFLRFWSPHQKHRNGRAALVEQLYRLMSDENVVFGKVDLLSEKVRAVLLALLKASRYTSDLQGLFRGVDGLEMEHYEAEAALTALARRGFVRISRAQEWLHYGRSAYTIPRETALVMRGLAGTDRRPLDQVFVHAGFRPCSTGADGHEPLAALPDDVSSAIAALASDELREIVTEVIERFGGICTRHEFGEVFGERGLRWDSAAFLHELGAAGLGTVGHLDLRDKGFGVDDDVLFVFAETVERYVGEWRARELEHDGVMRAHGDLMSDVRLALDEVADGRVRVAKEGAVYKSARARLAEKLQFRGEPLLEKRAVAERALAIVRGLHLAARNGHGELAVTERGGEWTGRPLLDKLRDAYGLFFSDEVQTLRSHHLRHIHRLVVELLTDPDTRGEWWPGSSLALLARNRYLLELVAADTPPHRAPLSISHAALTELAAAAQEMLVRDLFALGVVEVALRDGGAAGVRLSRLGERLLLEDEAAAPGDARPLVVNPDFELLVLPEGDVDDLLHELDRFAVREGGGEVAHYRLDRARIERVTVQGEPVDGIVEFLEEHARSPLPQNVVYSIRSWGDDVRSAGLVRGVLLHASDAAVVEAILNHAALKDHVERVLDRTTVFFDEGVAERDLIRELRELGVYLR